MIILSKRLQRIANLVPTGSKLADIGSDHAMLPVFLAQEGVVSKAVAGELNPGPYDAACKQVREAGAELIVSVRRGNGLEVVGPGEVDVVTIAGMGGSLIVDILSAGIEKLEGVRTLVLQPNVGEEAVRRWLVEHGWWLREEFILEEDGKIYEVLQAERAEDAERMNRELYAPRRMNGLGLTSDLLFKMGPYLVESGEPVFRIKWAQEADKLDKILHQLGRSELESSRQKEEQLNRKIAEIREVLHVSERANRHSMDGAAGSEALRGTGR